MSEALEYSTPEWGSETVKTVPTFRFHPHTPTQVNSPGFRTHGNPQFRAISGGG